MSTHRWFFTTILFFFFLKCEPLKRLKKIVHIQLFQLFDLNSAEKPIIRIQLRKIFTEPKFTLILNFELLKTLTGFITLRPQ